MSGVMGLDPSLTGTGLAHWSPTDGWDTGTIVTKGSNTDTYDTTGKRLDRIVTAATEAADRWKPDLLVIEFPAYSSNHGHATDRAGLFWQLVQRFRHRWPTPVVGYCDPRERIRYALGKRAGNKDAVLAAAIKRYPGANIRNNNEADAVLLAALGCRWVGEQPGRSNDYLTVDAPPQACREAVRHVQWPASLRDQR